MDFKYVISKIEQGLSYPEIAKELKIPVTTLKSRCIKANISAKNILKEKRALTNTKTCAHCKIEKAFADFYISKGKMIYCKACTKKVCTERKRKFKQLCLDYKGNSCIKCGYNKCPNALHFHHLDPSKKEFHLATHKSYYLSEKVKLELDKCILVCANCHAEIHS